MLIVERYLQCVCGTHQLLIGAEDVESIGKAVTALKKDKEVLSDVCP